MRLQSRQLAAASSFWQNWSLYGSRSLAQVDLTVIPDYIDLA
jgi:hypothetical protein